MTPELERRSERDNIENKHIFQYYVPNQLSLRKIPVLKESLSTDVEKTVVCSFFFFPE